MDAYENLIIQEVSEIILIDDYSKNDEVLLLIKKILNSVEYLEMIKKDFDKILEDKKIDSKDIPKMITIMIKLNNLIPKLTGIKEKISIDKMKYIFYATLYFYIIKYQVDFFDTFGIDEFRLLYSNLWNLVEINPDTVKVAAKKMSGFFCCGGSEIKESNEPVLK